MKLYLIRHGIAHNLYEEDITLDSQRKLTSQGKNQLKTIGTGLNRLKIQPDIICSSPLVRAKQTAEILAHTINFPKEIHTIASLAPGHSYSDLYKDLKSLLPFESVFLVGHEPCLGLLASHLLWTSDELKIDVKKASIIRIDIFDIPPTMPGVLKWIVTPKFFENILG